eukprot:3032984-Rhodomonas_salina.1
MWNRACPPPDPPRQHPTHRKHMANTWQAHGLRQRDLVVFADSAHVGAVAVDPADRRACHRTHNPRPPERQRRA